MSRKRDKREKRDKYRNEGPAQAGEEAQQESRQQAMATHERATRTQLSAGQTKVQRLHKGNQPRGG